MKAAGREGMRYLVWTIHVTFKMRMKRIPGTIHNLTLLYQLPYMHLLTNHNFSIQPLIGRLVFGVVPYAL